jgi:hypothetical protein
LDFAPVDRQPVRILAIMAGGFPTIIVMPESVHAAVDVRAFMRHLARAGFNVISSMQR